MVAHVRVPRWPQSPQRPSVPRTQAPTHSLPGIILTLEGTPGGEVPGHMARLVKTQISDPQASLQPFPVLPQGTHRRLRAGTLAHQS